MEVPRVSEIGQSHILRVAAVWGTTILDVRLLQRGQSYTLDALDDPNGQIPDGAAVSPMPLRAVAGGWEVDARGAIAGVMKLRGRDEDPVAMQAAPIPVVPGDYGLLQYGLYSIFFQYTAPAQTMRTGRIEFEALVGLALVSSAVFHLGALGLVRALMTPPPLDAPPELMSDDNALKILLKRSDDEPPPPPPPAQ